MVFKKLSEKLTKARAKSLGMTVAELKKARLELKRKEKQERLKHEKWKITEKYRLKRKLQKSRKPTDPFALLFGTPLQPQKKKPKKKRRKKKRRIIIEVA